MKSIFQAVNFRTDTFFCRDYMKNVLKISRKISAKFAIHRAKKEPLNRRVVYAWAKEHSRRSTVDSGSTGVYLIRIREIFSLLNVITEKESFTETGLNISSNSQIRTTYILHKREKTLYIENHILIHTFISKKSK